MECNQVPHLTQDTTWERDKITIRHHKQELSPFLAGDHKAAMNICDSMTNTRQNNTNYSQKKHSLGTVSKNILLEGKNQYSTHFFKAGL